MHRLIAALAVLWFAAPAWAGEQQLSFGRFGSVSIYQEAPDPGEVVLFVSGDGGWNQGVVDMARSLAGLGALVVGIDIVHYLKSTAGDASCTYVAGDLEQLSQFVQKKLGLRQYHAPILVGYSSGATLVYAALVQAPFSTFRGAVSLGFCPDLITPKALCKGSGLSWTTDRKLGWIFNASKRLQVPWAVLQGDEDQVCNPAQTRAYVGQVPNAVIEMLPKVGHGFSVQRNWLPQFKAAYARIAAGDRATSAAAETVVSDLPLTEVPAQGEQGDGFGIILTGDGGWAELDRKLGEALAARGMPVVGFSSLRYYWQARTPDEAAADLGEVIRAYAASWRKPRVTLIGYSFGADVLPFLVRRLPEDVRSRVGKVVLLGPSDDAVFEIGITDWLNKPRADAMPVKPEVEAMTGQPLLCVYGVEEVDSLCRKLGEEKIARLETKGGHHFDGNVAPIVEAILKP